LIDGDDDDMCLCLYPWSGVPDLHRVELLQVSHCHAQSAAISYSPSVWCRSQTDAKSATVADTVCHCHGQCRHLHCTRYPGTVPPVLSASMAEQLHYLPWIAEGPGFESWFGHLCRV